MHSFICLLLKVFKPNEFLWWTKKKTKTIISTNKQSIKQQELNICINMYIHSNINLRGVHLFVYLNILLSVRPYVHFYFDCLFWKAAFIYLNIFVVSLCNVFFFYFLWFLVEFTVLLLPHSCEVFFVFFFYRRCMLLGNVLHRQWDFKLIFSHLIWFLFYVAFMEYRKNREWKRKHI